MADSKDKPLTNKTILIVGATSGFGLAAARACAAAGGNVVGIGPDEASVEEARAAEDAVEFVVGNATDPETAENGVQRALDRFGRLHGLYHVAGGSGRRWGDGPAHEVSDEAWDRTIALNQTSVMYSNRAALNHFLEAGGGAIVNMSSVLAFAPASDHFATHAYAAAKAGIIGLTKSIASHYAANNIRANVVAPGCSDTPMAARASADPEIQAYLRSRQPLDGGRMGRAEDLDGAVVYLLSDASSFVTGQVLAIDGGWTISDGSAGA